MSELPTAFISYSWDSEQHKSWVRDIATRLRDDGINVTLDQWHSFPGSGHQLPEFMEKSIRENDFVLIICTPEYKEKSDLRIRGVGYEADIITAEIFHLGRRGKYISILRQDDWKYAAPTYILGEIYIDLREGNYEYEQNYHKLLATLRNQIPQAPPIGKPAITAPEIIKLSRPIRISDICTAGTRVVTFPVAFPYPPIVVATPVSKKPYTYSISDVSTTGFTINIWGKQGEVNDVSFNYVAYLGTSYYT